MAIKAMQKFKERGWQNWPKERNLIFLEVRLPERGEERKRGFSFVWLRVGPKDRRKGRKLWGLATVSFEKGEKRKAC